jgi:hypothetical protein
LEERRDDVSVTRWYMLSSVLGDAGTADEERDVDVLLNATGLSRGQSMLSNMEPVICRVDEIRVLQDLWTSAQASND